MKLLVATLLLLAGCRTALPGPPSAVEVFPTAEPTRLGVRGRHLSGTIFTADYRFGYPGLFNDHSVGRFTLTAQDVAAAEQLLATQLAALNRPRYNQTPGNPILERNLPHYFRQYVGYTRPDGHRLVHINCHWNEYSWLEKRRGYANHQLRFDSDYSVVFDGGSYYWSVEADLTAGQLIDLAVNGFG